MYHIILFCFTVAVFMAAASLQHGYYGKELIIVGCSSFVAYLTVFYIVCFVDPLFRGGSMALSMFNFCFQSKLIVAGYCLFALVSFLEMWLGFKLVFEEKRIYSMYHADGLATRRVGVSEKSEA